jgi:uridine kinase
VSPLDSAIETIVDTRRRVSADRCALVSISGIDASGKGYLTAKMAAALQTLGFRVADIHIDGWLNLPHVRFDNSNPAEHFYLRAIRFEEMFRQLIFPLRDRGSLTIEMDYAEETSTEFRTHLCAYVDIDIILLEGIFLLKRAFQLYYDLSF